VGSTSFKYKLFDMADETTLAEGRIERIGDDEAPVEHRIGDQHLEKTCRIPDYPSAIKEVMSSLSGLIAEPTDLDAVGFKTVHLRGEPGIYLLNEETLQRMADYNDLAPAHNPPYIQAVRIFHDLYPDLPLVGLFETAFHTTIPDYAYTYGVPYEWQEQYGVRKYGFHGASHRYVSQRVPELIDTPDEGFKLVSCHLGGSASLCAIVDGCSVDTTMGFSAQDGLLNSTRNGSIDPFIVPFIMDREGLSTSEIRDILSKKSGLLGISGISGDMRDLQKAAESGHQRAKLAVDAFCYGTKKQIAAMAAAMGGVDAIAFAGGIGERGTDVRRQVCEGLEFLGVRIAMKSNDQGPPERVISQPHSPVDVVIVNTNEEIIVARESVRFLQT
jgi:acetate kinase